MVKTLPKPQFRRRKPRHRPEQKLVFPGQSAPGALLYRVDFRFIKYHPESGISICRFVNGKIQAINQDEAVIQALALVQKKYEDNDEVFEYRIGEERLGSGAYLVYYNGWNTFVRAKGKENARALVTGKGKGKAPVFFIQVEEVKSS